MWPPRLGLFSFCPVSLPLCRPPSLVSWPCPLSSPDSRVLVSVWWPLQWRVGGVLAWQFGCGGGLCSALGVSPCGCTFLGPRGGWWLVCMLSGLGCGGASWWVCASGVARLVSRCGSVPLGCRGVDWVWGVGRCRVLRCGASPLRGCVPWRPSSHPPLSPVLWPPSVPSACFRGPSVVPCPCDVLLPSPCFRGCVPVTLRLSLSPCRGLSLCPFHFRCPGGGLMGGLQGTGGPCLQVGVLEPPAEGFGGVGGAEALNLVPEEHFQCPLRHGGLRGSVVMVRGGAGADFLEAVGALACLTPARSPGPPHPAAEVPHGGGGPPGEVGGG